MPRRNRENKRENYDFCGKIAACKLINCGKTHLEGPVTINGPTTINNDLTVTGTITGGTIVGGSIRLPISQGVPTIDPTPPGQIFYDIVDRQVAISDGNIWQIYESSEDAPALITVDPTAVPNNSTVFNTIQAAIDSLNNQRTNTTIRVLPGIYPENLVYTARLASTDPLAITTLRLQGDTRNIVGTGISHNQSWNRQAVPGPVGGGNGSRAVLAGVIGGLTITVMASPGTNPDFVAAGVIPTDRVLVRHNTGTVPQFELYTIVTVAPTVLTLSSPLLGNVNALGAALVIVANVEVVPPSGSALVPRGVIAVDGFFFRGGAPGTIVIGGQSDTVCILNNNTVYGGGAQVSSNQFAVFRTDLTPFGDTFFDASTTLGTFDLFGNGLIRGENSLVAPRDGTRASFADIGSLMRFSNTNIIGSGLSDGLVHARHDSTTYFSGTVEIVATSPANPAVAAFGEAKLIVTVGNQLRIRGTPALGVLVAMGSEINTTNGTIALDVPTAPASFIGVRVGNSELNAANAGGDAVVGFNIQAIPPGSLIASVYGDSRLAVTAITQSPGAIGANSSGFLVQAGSSLVWTALGASANLIGDGGTGILFDIREHSSLTIPAIIGQRNFSGYRILFNINAISTAYIASANLTSAIGGENLRVANGSKAVIGNVTINPNGNNVGIREFSGGEVVFQTSTTVVNNATIPTIRPTAVSSDPTTTVTILPNSTEVNGTMLVTTLGGIAPFTVIVTLNTPLVVPPVVSLSGATVVINTITNTSFTFTVFPIAGVTNYLLTYIVSP